MSDVTNELFMQQTYSDTTFLGRHLVGEPEFRSGMVASLDWARALRSGTWSLAVRPDFVVGDKLSQLSITSSLRRPVVDRWSWSLEPTLQGSVDRSFGLDRRALGAVISGRARRELGWAREQALELRASGDFLQLVRQTRGYDLSHRNAMFGVGFERAGLAPFELRAEERTYVRTFPDSVARDHYEQQLSVSAAQDIGGTQTIAVRLQTNWRTTIYDAPSSRDRFSLFEGQAEWTLHAGLQHTFQVQYEGEATRYAEPDSLLDFDYQVHRTGAKWTWRLGSASSVSAGTRWEWLRAPWNPIERYREGAALLEFERFTLGTWLSIAPALVWRRYEETSSGSGFDLEVTHSHFDGVELFTMLDQAIPGGFRVRSTGMGRMEWHRTSADDSRSLYFSLDVRRLF
ncbi:MAG: hypothetical protein U0704_00880 [Candidatus Eisenbacteria bacterium]